MSIQLYLGDCLEIMPQLEEKSIDAVICDPPYGSTACKWDVVISFQDMWSNLERLIKPNGVIVLFGCEPFSSLLRISNLKRYRYDWIWEKERPTNVFTLKKEPGKVYENISVFWDKPATYNPLMTPSMQPKNNNKNKNMSQAGNLNIISTKSATRLRYSEYYDPTVRYPRNIIKISRGTRSKRFHPTQKPIALMEYLIKTYTNEGDVVLDFTMGSGSTGVAAKRLNRNFIGIEKEEKYFRIAEERINNELV